ncbi:MAG TPA: hypothetical protein PKZ76_11250, partial [Xanthomonadaceae bacterium]|nr:hypothetical protein [Xanthomonadaceae bacterium]
RTWTVTAELDPYHPDEQTVEAFPGGNSGVLLALTAGRLTVEPAELTETTEYLQTSSRNLAMINDGTAPVTFDVSIETEVIPVVSADFEGSVPPAGWMVNSLDGAPPCVWRRNDDLVNQSGAPAAPRANFAGGDGFSAAADSDRCGNGSTMDTELVSPIIDFSALEDPSLEFVLSFRVLGASRLDIDVSTDAGDTWTTIESYTTSVSATGPGTPQSFSLNAFSASNEGRVRFRYVAPGWHWWAQVDQVRIGGQAQWMTVTPGDGTFNVPADATGQLLTVGFDATQVPGPGTYEGMIRIANDTPYDGGLVEVPVTFNVTPAPGQSRLEGGVSGLGYCDAENYPAAGASVNVIGQNNTFGLTADDDGAFGLWLNTSEAPLTIEVAAAGHVGQTDSGVGLGSQQTTTRNYNLRLDAPCGSVSPDSVSASQDPNTTSIVQVVLRNDGAAQLDWTEGSGGQSVLVLEQTDNAANGIVSSRFLGLNPVTGAYSAEDFAFGGGGISSIRVDGFRTGGGSIALTATELAFFIYPDAGGVPAGHPEDGGGTESWSFAAAPNHPAFSIGPDSRITLNVVAADGQPVQLSPGHYWVVAYATVPGTEGSIRWNWFAAAAGQATGFYAQIITPGAAFGGGFPDWASIAENVDPVFAGLGLRIDSQVACSTIANTVDGSGSVGPDGVAILNIEVDTTGVPPGNYDEIVCLLTNDAQAALITVAVELEVTMPASFGTLEGTITSSGYCDLESDPLAGAGVEIAGQTFTYNLSTGPDGGYSIAVDSLDGPYTVTVNAAGHLQGQSVGVVVNAGATTVEDLELRLDAPCASADPDSLSASAASGTSTQVDLDIINSGAASFDWAIAFEEDVALLGGGPIDVVQDGSFEAGSPNAFWAETSTNFGTPLCTVAGCGTGGGTGPRTGSWWAWFGGTTAAETGSVAQDVTIPPATSAELRFWLEIPASATPGFLEVRLGGDVVFSATQADAGSFGNYTEVVVDVLAYADGVERELLFFSQTTAGATTNFFVDDVSLVVEPGGTCVSPAGVDWLSADPATGTTAGDDTDTVSISFDASTLTEGLYEATLCLSTTDTQNPLIVIPVEFEVTVPPPPPVVIDISGQESPSMLCGDGTNPGLPSINVDIGANTPVLTVAWDTLLETNGGSWATEAAILFGTTSTRFEVSLRPGIGVNEPTPPGGTQFSGGPVDMVGAGLDFEVESDGLLWLTFCETFNDGANPDAFWLDPSTVTVNAPLDGLVQEGNAAALSRTLSHPGGK